MSIANIVNMMLQENVDIGVINALKSLAHIAGFSETLFVSSTGDNSDGSSWEKAYNEIEDAYDAASNDSGDYALIFIGAGLFDIDKADGLAVAKNIAFVGMGHTRTTIKNSHASNAYVFSCSKPTTFANLRIYREGSCDGIRLESGAKGSILFSVRFNFWSEAAAAGTALKITSSDGVVVTDFWCKGDGANTIAIYIDTSARVTINGEFIHDCATGIQIVNAASDDNVIKDIDIGNCTLGLDIDAGDENHFHHIDLHDCTTNIDDDGTDTIFLLIHLAPKAHASIVPDNLTGITVTAAAGANNWTAVPVEVKSAGAKPCYITGVVYEPAAGTKWGLRLSDDGGSTWFWAGIVEETVNKSNRLEFGSKYFINQGKAIVAASKSEGGGNNLDLWVKIEEI